MQHTAPGPGQWLVGFITTKAQQVAELGVTVEIHWVLEHMGFEENVKCDKVAK